MKQKIINLICKIQLWQLLVFYCPLVAIGTITFSRTFCPSEELIGLYLFGSFYVLMLPGVLVQIIQYIDYYNKNSK